MTMPPGPPVSDSHYQQLLTDLHLQSEILKLNNQLLRSAGTAATTANVFREVIKLCHQAVEADQVFLIIHDSQTDELVGVIDTNTDYHPQGHYRFLMDDVSLAVWIFKEGRSVTVDDVEHDPRVNQRVRQHFHIRSTIGTPLRLDGEINGVLMAVTHERCHHYTERDVAIFEGLAREAAFALQAQRLREQRQIAEQALRIKDNAIIASINGIALADMEGRLTYVNQSFLSMWGYQNEAEVIGRSSLDFWENPTEAANVIQALTVTDRWSGELTARHRDGSLFTVLLLAALIRDSSEQPVQLTASFVDISERKRAEEDLRRQNRLLRTIASSIEILVRDQSEQEYMENICRLLVEDGQFRMAWVGMIAEDGIHVRTVAEAGYDDDYLARADIRCDDSPQGQGPTGMAIRLGKSMINDDVETNIQFARWREQARAQGYRSSASTPLRLHGRVIGTLNVYSATPHAFGENEVVLIERLAMDLGHTMERRAAESALRSSEAQFRLLLDSTAEGIYGVNHDGICTFVNAAAIRLLGYQNQQDLVGKHIHSLIHHSFADGRPYPAELCQVRRGAADDKSVNIDNEVYWRADGGSFPVEYWSHPMYQGNQRIGSVVTFIDISERKQVEAKLEQYRVELEQRVEARTAALLTANQELESFSYSVSHDLRAPLRAIDGFSRILMEDHAQQFDSDARHYFERIRAAVQRMGILIDDLLQLSRVGRNEMQITKVDLSLLAREVIEQLEVTEPQRKVAVTIMSGMTCEGDTRLLRLVLQNLLGNAWKYTRNTPQAHIEFGVISDQGEDIYYVRDNGAGFDMAYSNKLFKPFQRLHRHDAFEGTGVGLAIVARVVARHSGRVWAEGQVDEGACFYFVLGA